MFRKALQIAAQFTFPVIISRKTVAGQCSCNIGTFVVINEDGWIVTAGHILSQWIQLTQHVEATQAAQAQHVSIKADASLTNKERAKRLNAIPISKDANEQCSAWWTWQDVQLKDVRFIAASVPGWGEIIDVGVGRLEPFDPLWVTTYPTFKSAAKDFEPGTSLCKLGFPFHQVQVTWDAATKKFMLPAGALPMPRFPIEGMFTRVSQVEVKGSQPPPFPVKYVETSTPGLPGQSGGPTFDIEGRVWAIQAKTSSIPLIGKQYFNVGLGVHPETMFPFFDEAGIKYQIAD
jgi:hypothetical protein